MFISCLVPVYLKRNQISSAVSGIVHDVLNSNRKDFGEILVRITSAFPISFLEPDLNKYNPVTVYNALSIKDRQNLRLSKNGIINTKVSSFGNVTSRY